MGQYKDLPEDVKAFMMDADRLQRMHDREANPPTKEDLERKQKFTDKNDDIKLLLEGKMTTEEYEQKWGITE